MRYISQYAPKAIEVVIQELSAGHPVILPTETVYGLVAVCTKKEAITQIYALKQRSQHKPLSMHLFSIERALYWVYFDDKALKLANTYWPGPITLLLKPKLRLVSFLEQGISSVPKVIGVRVPNHPFFSTIAHAFFMPLVATSVNISGQASAKTAQEVQQIFGYTDLLVVDGGHTSVGQDSTVLSTNPPYLVRKGAIPLEPIQILTKQRYTSDDPTY